MAEWLMAADCKSAALGATEVRILPCAPEFWRVDGRNGRGVEMVSRGRQGASYCAGRCWRFWRLLVVADDGCRASCASLMWILLGDLPFVSCLTGCVRGTMKSSRSERE